MQSYSNFSKCLNQHAASHISSSLQQFLCSESGCSYSQKQFKSTSIYQMIRQIKDKAQWDWEGYENVINFYNINIKTLQTDRDQLLKRTIQLKHPNISYTDQWLLKTFESGQIDSSRNFYCSKIIQTKKDIDKVLAGIQKQFDNVLIGIRSIWMENKTLLQIQRATKEIKSPGGTLLYKFNEFKKHFPESNINNANCKAIQSITINQNSIQAAKQLLMFCLQLQTITLCISSHNLADIVGFKVGQTLCQFPKLKQLKLKINTDSSQDKAEITKENIKNFYEQLEELIQLQKLQIIFNIIRFQELLVCIPKIRSLRSLKVVQTDYCSKNRYITCEHVFKGFEQLEELDIYDLQFEQFGYQYLSKLKHLKRLRLDSSKIQTESLYFILGQLSQLEVLSIERKLLQYMIFGQKNHQLMKLSQLNQRLRQLNLDHCKIDDKGIMLAILNYPNLAILSMYNPEFNYARAYGYISKLKSLTHFKTSYVKDHAFTRKLIKNLKQLKQLNVMIFQKRIKQLKDHNPIIRRQNLINFQFNQRIRRESQKINKIYLRNQILLIEKTQINSKKIEKQFKNTSDFAQLRVSFEPLQNDSLYSTALDWKKFQISGKHSHTSDLQ